MKIRAAVTFAAKRPLEIVELDLGGGQGGRDQSEEHGDRHPPHRRPHARRAGLGGAVPERAGPRGRRRRARDRRRRDYPSRRAKEELRALADGLAVEQAALQAVFQSAVGLSLAAASGRSVLIINQMRRSARLRHQQGVIDRYLETGAIYEEGSSYQLAEYLQVNAVLHGVSATAEPFLIRRPNGSRLRNEISSAPLCGEDGVVSGAVSVVVELEDRKRAIAHQAVLPGELASRIKTADYDGRLSIEGSPVAVGARRPVVHAGACTRWRSTRSSTALSVPEGSVAVTWQVEANKAGERLAFSLSQAGGGGRPSTHAQGVRNAADRYARPHLRGPAQGRLRSGGAKLVGRGRRRSSNCNVR